jgi:hypothetical protein
LKKRIAILATALITTLGLLEAKAASAPPQPPRSHHITQTAPTPQNPPTTQQKPSQPPLQATWRHTCPNWQPLALQVGWPAEQLPTLTAIIYHESRCQPNAHNPDDPNTGSYGAGQINGFWCRPSRYFPAGWLQTQRILTTCTDLYNPETTLRAMLAVWQYGGWEQWSTYRLAKQSTTTLP